MRFPIFALALILLPLDVFSDTQLLSPSKNKNATVYSYSNDQESSSITMTRTMDVPTHVIRMSKLIEGFDVNCQEVNQLINTVLIKKITSDKFTQSTVVTCNFDPQTRHALSFSINSFFDPMTDEGVRYLNDYLSEYNGYNLFGHHLKIEAAKGLVITLSLSAGIKKNPNTPLLVEYRRDHSNFYFKSFYAMKYQLIADIKENFLTNDPNKILPFLDRWIFNHAGKLYKVILRDSNYAQIHPEVVFLMDDGEEIFSSPLRYNFPNVCEQYENHHCLATESQNVNLSSDDSKYVTTMESDT